MSLRFELNCHITSFTVNLGASHVGVLVEKVVCFGARLSVCTAPVIAMPFRLLLRIEQQFKDHIRLQITAYAI